MNIHDDISRLQITAPGRQTREFSSPLGIISIGRQPGSDLALKPPQAFRWHPRLSRADGEGEIGNQGSSDGTQIDTEKSPTRCPRSSSNGKEIKLGDFRALHHHIPVNRPGGCLAKATV